jgi:uncharacterized membrane protein
MLDDQEAKNEDTGISGRLLGFLLLGIALVFIGIAVLVVFSLISGGSASAGGVILIGPIPIIFGAGPDAGWLIVIGVLITVFSVVFFFLMNRHTREEIAVEGLFVRLLFILAVVSVEEN